MCKYFLKLFNRHSQYVSFSKSDDFELPNVSHCIDKDEVHYNIGEHNYEDDYLTFVAKEDGTFKFVGSITENTLSYSLDNGRTWIELADNTDTPTVTSGSKILWKGNCTPQTSTGIGNFSSTGNFEVEGNAMSLLFGDDFIGQTSLEGKNYALYGLFRENTNILNAKNLSLPATTLAICCYYSMFQGCTSLTIGPVLSTTTLANYCYVNMFKDCISLTTAPELPATILADYCYYSMFRACTSLTQAPELPATTLAANCYYGMFYNCTSLTTAPELPATMLAECCYQYMFYGCTGLISAPSVLPATTLASNCYGYMFYECTSLTSTPQLYATTLANSCCYCMFYHCIGLTTAPTLYATTLLDKSYYYMFYACTSITAITCLATDISATDCTKNWVSGLPASGTFKKADVMSSWTTGYSGIPSGWSIVDAS